LTTTDDLGAARLAFPVRDRVRGTVSAIPMGLGRTGILVDLGQPPQGWVDVVHLPEDPTHWPAVGVTGLFEVLQHRPGQVRLFPLDAGMRGRQTRFSRWAGEEWAEITRRYPRTRAYVAGRTAEGKTTKEIIRCLKRYIAREIYKALVAHPGPRPTAVGQIPS
jgi:hypothetical protein